MMKKKINATDDLPPLPLDETIISDIYAPGESNQLKADAWKEAHNLRVDIQNKPNKKLKE